MRSRDFVYWLQGYLEIMSVDEAPALSAKQVECVKKHLALVFVHEIDPSMSAPAPKTAHEAKLDEAHEPAWKKNENAKPGGPAFRC